MPIQAIEFTVPGIARPAGSKRAFALKKGGVYTGRVAVADDCAKSRDWKSLVSTYAAHAMQGKTLFEGPVGLTVTVYTARPKSHLSKSGLIKDSAPPFPVTRPDVLKLARAIEDALTGIVWRDDSQIVTETLYKRYTHNAPHVYIRITEEIKFP